jgi:ubiquinone/menaquinone biosynthesis C-methylase UbiE
MSTLPSHLSQLAASIPPSPSDELLRAWGHDLAAEYLQVVTEAGITPGSRVLELATGTGRMTAVLTRLGYSVLGGDSTDEKTDQVWNRVQPEYARLVKLTLLDMRELPFKPGSVPAITCMNTLHELQSPHECLQEMLRVHDHTGVFILGDFNETGFDTMQRLHQHIYQDNHPCGRMNVLDAEPILKRHFKEVRTIHTPLNITFIASGKSEAAANPDSLSLQPLV